MPSKGRSATRTTAPPTVYQLRVTLRGIRPPIWRRVQVTGDMTLESLHRILQDVMGWHDGHLWEFRISGKSYGPPDACIAMEVLDASRVRLADLAPRARSKLTYRYDFGDDWHHDLVVEKVFPAEPGRRYPACVAGARACPPEDCGGIWGYDELLSALETPDNEESAELLEWAGEDFDPEAFDAHAINAFLHAAPRWGPPSSRPLSERHI